MDLNLEASRLGFQHRGLELSLEGGGRIEKKEEEEEKKEKSPLTLGIFKTDFIYLNSR